jgi:hypothetical protein
MAKNKSIAKNPPKMWINPPPETLLTAVDIVDIK